MELIIGIVVGIIIGLVVGTLTYCNHKLWVTIERRKQHGKQQGGSERERA